MKIKFSHALKKRLKAATDEKNVTGRFFIALFLFFAVLHFFKFFTDNSSMTIIKTPSRGSDIGSDRGEIRYKETSDEKRKN